MTINKIINCCIAIVVISLTLFLHQNMIIRWETVEAIDTVTTVPQKSVTENKQYISTEELVKRIAETSEPLPTETPYVIKLTESEQEILAKLIYAEAGASYISQEARLYVCATAINLSRKYGKSIEDICTATRNGAGRYFSVAPYVDRVTPSQACYEAVYATMLDGGKVESGVTCFRLGYYWQGYCWGGTYVTPICRINGIYFSKF